MLSKLGLRRRLIGGAAGMVRYVRYYSSSSSAANRATATPMVILPVINGMDVGYEVRNLAEESVFFGVKKRRLRGCDTEAKLVGSSQGWLVLFNKSKDDLYLVDPLSESEADHRIKLPPVRTLPEPYLNLDLDGHATVSKVVLSSSPDDEDCCAVMIFSSASRLARCYLHRSSEWTPVGPLFIPESDYIPFVRFAYIHEDLVYCSRSKAFTSVTPCEIFNLESSKLCIRDRRRVTQRSYVDCNVKDYCSLSSLYRLRGGGDIVLHHEVELEQGGATQIWVEENKDFLIKHCVQIPHLVYVEQSDQLFLVIRFVTVIDHDDDGCGGGISTIPYCSVKGLKEIFECRTYGFIVMEIGKDREGEYVSMCRVVEDLNGMAIFVGINESFVVPATAANQLNPNVIYFTDARRIRMMSGVNDNGVFDYQNKTVSRAPTDISGGIFSLL
ncbi:hypothetical protein OROMI_004340 [Orobanche minor]